MSLRLRHFTLVGSGAPATAEFGPHLTVIYGASDTGKSYIVEGIDYVLGASDLKRIPESDAYNACLLGIDVNGAPTTLLRGIPGDSSVSLYDFDLRSTPTKPPSRTLAAKHASNTPTISTFLLEAIGLADLTIRTNKQGGRRSVSFRDIAWLCVVSETAMQSEISPVTKGQWVTDTANKATFRLLVEGATAASREFGSAPDPKAANAQAALLERLIGEVRADLGDAPTPEVLLAQLKRTDAALSERLVAINELVSERDAALESRREVEQELDQARTRLVEVQELEARFALLMAQYESDLSRLQMVAEAGDLLGYLSTGVCVFCGAEVEHQHPTEPHIAGEATQFAVALDAEVVKVGSLREDLRSTLDDVRAEGAAVASRISDATATLAAMRARLGELDEALEPHNEQLSDLLRARSAIEGRLSSYDQLQRYADLLAEFATRGRGVAAVEAPSPRALVEFAALMEQMLVTWGVPDVTPVEVNPSTYELMVGGQPRRSRGKGMRALVHAAFNLALAEYCIARGMPHPGFVVLDSPLVTYRGPDDAPSAEDVANEAMPQTVAQSFFRYLDTEFPAQVVVFENTDPPDLSKRAQVLHFTKNPEAGRYGFV